MTNDKIQMSIEIKNQNDKKYDLAERTALFGEEIIRLAKELSKNEINRPLISQVVRAGTSIGANYMEADGADSKKDFQYRIGVCKREAKETRHWLRMIARANETQAELCTRLSGEAMELALIFASIVRTSRARV